MASFLEPAAWVHPRIGEIITGIDPKRIVIINMIVDGHHLVISMTTKIITSNDDFQSDKILGIQLLIGKAHLYQVKWSNSFDIGVLENNSFYHRSRDLYRTFCQIWSTYHIK